MAGIKTIQVPIGHAIVAVPLKAKQMLMELPDAGMRIEIVHRFMRQHHIV